MRQEFVAAGFGSQGIISMGIVVCTAAGLYDNKMVAQNQSNGPVARGGACRTEVVISDAEIDYPRALTPDIMILMSEQARDRYLSEVNPEQGQVLIDSTLVAAMPPQIKNVYRIPATDIAETKLGQRAAAGMVMLGAMAALTGLVSYQGLQAAVRDTGEGDATTVDLKALEEGYAYGRTMLMAREGGAIL
ncbi:MAG: 2-oxoglutarate ferredoxin oxidoreductase subunit gamma [Clostridia bacterium]|nr:2-oxoglutarate ferredoxin oxidoreductase subunit gamma [Clostridia bacterium]